ncbi:bestrophin family ion channel [Siphonobacter sp. SORGH_AS_0500]|uniref:bestrophin family protein n=1 Tax=Siphonobacter sp. SORGH_AS_0500 TaxID=1864824 RepID=UPI002857DE0E|nr:bestrophin family ion channel [Siphonobacter sp. SORGH_AS_0500]MDR6195378.1 putative membrane protein [Siphonobacter sp. SORGH_AS_0500]
MFVQRNLKWSIIVHYTWRSMIYYFALSFSVYLLHDYYDLFHLHLPFSTITALSTALSIFLGFKNNNAYDRWWEARQIWGLLVNYSRAWTREILTMIIPTEESEREEVRQFQRRMANRHMAYVHGLRVFLRKKNKYIKTDVEEIYEESNEYSDTESFLSQNEYRAFTKTNNPPNYLINLQGDDLREAYERGWLTDYRFTKLSETLTEFNNIQGRSERIKNTPFPRQYSFFSRIFVFIHASLLPFVFVDEIGWSSIPISIIISFVFLCLDQLGERIEDPFENRAEGTPLTSISLGIETLVKEHLGDTNFPVQKQPEDGVVL